MFSPMDLEDLSDWSAQNFRDYRRKGYLDLIGTRLENGRWRYSRRDGATVWLAGIIHERDRLIDLNHIFGQAYGLADDLLAHIDGKPAPRYAAAVYTRDENGLHGWEAIRTDSIDAIDVPGLVSVEALDLAALARIAPDKLRKPEG